MTTTATFQLHTLPPAVLERARSIGLDASGAPVRRIEAEGGEPLRCCLRNARPGDACLLFNFEPPLPAGTPYRELGAVFTHAEDCPGPEFLDRYPTAWYGRPQVLRAYDARGWIHPSTTVHDGRDPEAAIAAIFLHPEVVEIHSRNIAYGCYMFTITRCP
jgi:hypothetical protein